MYSVIRIKDGKVMAQFGTHERACQYLDACVKPYLPEEQPEVYKGTTMADYKIELRSRLPKEELGHQEDTH